MTDQPTRRAAAETSSARPDADAAPKHARPTPSTRSDRLAAAVPPAAVLTAALLVGGAVTERLRPAESPDRGFLATPFLWAIVVWSVVLAVDAIAFERSQVRSLERRPLIAAGGAAAVVFVVGLMGVDGGSFVRRVTYLLANSAGVLMFWWAVFSLVYLLALLVRATER